MSSPAAWHPDPSGEHEHRYWDGERWTDHVADAGVAATDPLPPAPADAPVWSGHAPSSGQTSSGPAPASAAAPSGLATTALVLGIVSLPMLIVFGLGALLGVAAVIVGIMAVRRTSRGEASGRGMAIGGIVTGALSIVFGILIVISLFAFGFGFASELEACIEETGSQAICQERLERELTDRFLGDRRP